MVTSPSFGDYLRHLRTVGAASEFPAEVAVSRRPRLSRAELAATTDIGGTYLAKLEQGHASHPSPEVVDRLAHGLGASDLEHQHLRDLAAPPLPVPHDSGRPPEITPVEREFVDSMRPHLAGYIDEAWTVLYANDEYARVFRGIEDWGNVLVWFFAERQSRTIMAEWEIEARLTVAWLRSHMARRRHDPRFTAVLRELSRYGDFVAMWERREILMGRHTPYMRVRDLDRDEEITLRAQVFPTPAPYEARQLYMGVRTPGQAGGATS